MNIGLQLVDACWNTYASTAYDILILSHLTHVLSNLLVIVPALALKLSLLSLATAILLAGLFQANLN